MQVKSESEVALSRPTPSDPMDCSPPGSSIHGIGQARVLEWGAIAFSLGAFKFVAFALDLRASRFALDPLSKLSVPYISVILLTLIPVDFQKKRFSELVTLCQSPESGCLMWVQSLSFSWENSVF